MGSGACEESCAFVHTASGCTVGGGATVGVPVGMTRRWVPVAGGHRAARVCGCALADLRGHTTCMIRAQASRRVQLCTPQRGHMRMYRRWCGHWRAHSNPQGMQFIHVSRTHGGGPGRGRGVGNRWHCWLLSRANAKSPIHTHTHTRTTRATTHNDVSACPHYNQGARRHPTVRSRPNQSSRSPSLFFM